MRKEVIGNATLYLGDCREILPTLPKVDVVVTDPPYSARTHAGARTAVNNNDGGRVLVTFDSLDAAQFEAVARMLLAAAERWVVMTCDHAHAALLFDWPEFVRLGAWVKHAPMPQLTGDRPASGHESIAILHGAGKKRWNGGSKAAIWRHTVLKNPADCLVPTQKPLPLVADLVADFTEAGATVCDPFMGSGTTGEACLDQGRSFIGIEADEVRFNIACRRIEDAHRQARMFA